MSTQPAFMVVEHMAIIKSEINELSSYPLDVTFLIVPTSITWFVWDEDKGTKLAEGTVQSPDLTVTIEVPPDAAVITDTTKIRQKRIFVVVATFGTVSQKATEKFEYYVRNLGGLPI